MRESLPKKRKNRTPGVYERSPGCWYIRFKDERGRDIRKAAESEKHAIALRAYWIEEIRKRKSPIETSAKELKEKQKASPTVGELIDRYRPEFAGQSAERNVRKYAEVWKAELGDEIAKDVTARDVKLWQREQEILGKSGATINRYTAYLRRIFNLAIRDLVLTVNPVGQGRVKAKKETARKRVISRVEERAILERFKPMDRAAFILSLYGGLRQEEVLQLERPDVDFQNRLLTLRDTKAGEDQVIPINSAMKEALSFVMSQHDGKLLFPSKRKPGRPISGSALTKRLKDICADLGFEGILWHTTRHTFVTRLAERGHGIGTVKDLARHSAITVTSGYLHTERAANLEAMESLCEGGGEVLFPAAPANRGHLRALP